LQFNSTATYANRYDLDEIDVFLEGNSSNPMFFNVSGLPQALSFGKHYFNISLLSSLNYQYELVNNSRVLFEFKSINNVVLKSDVSSVNQRNGIATCFVDILEDPLRSYKEIQDGQGTLTIAGSLQNKENTQNLIPEKFIGAINYRCIFPINIAKNILNADSPFILQTEHKTESIKGMFSFAKASISPLKNSAVGLTYNPTTGLPNKKVKTTSIGRAPS
tara:strand:- start:463 stop:1119 length:657 start_codon:yes stop_codon:yes gene_type:complete